MSLGLFASSSARVGNQLIAPAWQPCFKLHQPFKRFFAACSSPSITQGFAKSCIWRPTHQHRAYSTSKPQVTAFQIVTRNLGYWSSSGNLVSVPPRTLAALRRHTQSQHTLAPSAPSTMASTRSSKRKQENDISQTAKRRKAEPAIAKDDPDEMSLDGDQSPKALNGAESESEEEVQSSGKVAAVAETKEWQATIERVVSTAVSIVRASVRTGGERS